ncbi:MAG: methyltransferase domain-containing protein [Actinomycetota bacterium]|nr:methyltransferase domain-containing protein [Actinomycetota bacterium]
MKACCADFYQHDLVTLLLGDDYHPGGQRLTRRLAQLLQLRSGQRVLDLACARGTTALLLAEELGSEVVGVDIGVENLARARARAAARGLDHRVRLLTGDAEHLPLKEASIDVVICECALATFPDKSRAAAELARVLRPGGRLGLADITIDPDRLDPRLRTATARMACIADARPVDGYQQLLQETGLQVTSVEAHDMALLEMIERIDARLAMLGVLVRSFAVDPQNIHDLVQRAERAVREGQAGYALILATKPQPAG